MSRQYSIGNLTCFYCLVVIILAMPADVFSAGKDKVKGPIIITSETLTADNKTNTAIFEGAVIARTTDLTIYAGRMIVQYNGVTGNVTQIDAQEAVKLIKENRVITSKEATYFANEEKVIFTGEPRAVQEENVITGKKMTYFMDEDRFVVEDSKVFLIKK
ncbi:MAG: lipopolysaccharide transport periplasmic protein LptA [Nitrospirae bacterium]|nr:lipopolysaccharide transport periplasmic protein LptA [Nitrospirota bacterium]